MGDLILDVRQLTDGSHVPVPCTQLGIAHMETSPMGRDVRQPLFLGPKLLGLLLSWGFSFVTDWTLVSVCVHCFVL